MINVWTQPFRYKLGLDNVCLRPESPSPAWRKKGRLAAEVDRQMTEAAMADRVKDRSGNRRDT